MDTNGYKKIIEELLKLLNEGVYIVDKDGVCLFYNEAMAAIEQIRVEDVLGKEYHKAFPGVKIEESTMFRALKKGLPTPTQEQQYRNLYGRDVNTINATVPVKQDGEVIAAIEVARDITRLRDMSDTILELQEKKSGRESGEGHNVNPKIKKYTFDDLIGVDPKFSDVVERAKKAAKNNATVFIYGETGTGKELFAQSIHHASDRRDKPFLAQNCAALPETLLEGILFGTSRGGFTGAVDRAGLFEQANGGTLLLDEVSAMPYDLQGKLLRVLQEEYIRRVGGLNDIPIDTRIMATVNEDPQKLISDGRLRKDLYYRLNVVNISIPPLRSRPGDIPLLVEHFMAENNQRFGKELWMLGEKALSKLEKYDFPGNVRELENMIIQAISMAGKEHVLSEKLLQLPTRPEVVEQDVNRWFLMGTLPEYLESLEKEIIRETLLDNGGNVSKSADKLGIKRQNLQHKMRKYDLKDKE